MSAKRTSKQRTPSQCRKDYDSALSQAKRIARPRRRAPDPPSCFLSYAWGDRAHERWVERLALNLRDAGFEVLLDRWANSRIGSSIGRFVDRMHEVDYVLFIGTPAALAKSNNGDPRRGRILAAERDLLDQRLTGTEAQKESVLPLICAGTETSALPPKLRCRVSADFRNSRAYFPTLFDLILTMYELPFDDALVLALRRRLAR